MSSLNPEKRKNRRDRRPENPRRMYETERDVAIVKLVYQYRLLSQQQLERLLGKSRSTVQQSLVRLYHHRYLERVFLPIAKFGSSPTLYILDKRGIELLMRQGIEDFPGIPNKNLSGLFLEHTLAMNEFRIALTQACRTQGWTIETWLTENELKADYDRVKVRGKGQPVALIPDSYFMIDIPEKGVAHFFLEMDRGTMTARRFKEKVEAYVTYYRSGGYAQRYNAQGFRVLTVTDTPTPDRSTNLAQAVSEVQGIGRRFWFAHLPEITATTALTQPIWWVAGEMDKQPLFTL